MNYIKTACTSIALTHQEWKDSAIHQQGEYTLQELQGTGKGITTMPV